MIAASLCLSVPSRRLLANQFGGPPGGGAARTAAQKLSSFERAPAPLRKLHRFTMVAVERSLHFPGHHCPRQLLSPPLSPSLFLPVLPSYSPSRISLCCPSGPQTHTPFVHPLQCTTVLPSFLKEPFCDHKPRRTEAATETRGATGGSIKGFSPGLFAYL